MAEEKEEVYQKDYKLRMVSTGAIEITVPRAVIERAARKEKQNVAEFIRTHRVVHLYNNFISFDAAYRFVRVEEVKEIKEPAIA